MSKRNDTRELAKALANKTRGNWYIMDGFDNGFYICFDFDEAEEAPPGTCDVIFSRPGEMVHQGFIFKRNAKFYDVLRVLSAIGIDRFGEQVKEVFYKHNQILRAKDSQ